jgi:glutamate synthase (ferredoxin)
MTAAPARRRLSSIKHAGGPWELGLAEAHQTLVLNNLRSRIYVEADGQLKTGRDVAIAALLGAEEFGFATAPLVSLGCIMMRVCHLNTCPSASRRRTRACARVSRGAAGQRRQLHALRRAGTCAKSWRSSVSANSNDMVGRTDKLLPWKAIEHWKAKGLDLTPILHQPEMGAEVGRYRSAGSGSRPGKILDVTKLAGHLQAGHRARRKSPRRTAHHQRQPRRRHDHRQRNDEKTRAERLAGRHDASQIQRQRRPEPGRVHAAGHDARTRRRRERLFRQRFERRQNHCLSAEEFHLRAEDNIIIGNVALYGATAGEIFVRGMAGERFGVRNSGVNAVVEAVGDHGCEYMTGGRVVILGKTGRNFAAGMSGGVAYVLDEAGDFATRCNMELVGLEKLDGRGRNRGLEIDPAPSLTPRASGPRKFSRTGKIRARNSSR